MRTSATVKNIMNVRAVPAMILRIFAKVLIQFSNAITMIPSLRSTRHDLLHGRQLLQLTEDDPPDSGRVSRK